MRKLKWLTLCWMVAALMAAAGCGKDSSGELPLPDESKLTLQ